MGLGSIDLTAYDCVHNAARHCREPIKKTNTPAISATYTTLDDYTTTHYLLTMTPLVLSLISLAVVTWLWLYDKPNTTDKHNTHNNTKR